MTPRPILNSIMFTRSELSSFDRSLALVNYLASNKELSPTHYGSSSSELTRFKQSSEVANFFSATNFYPNDELHSWRFFLERKKRPKYRGSINWSTLPQHKFTKSSYSISSKLIEDRNLLNSWVNYLIGIVNIQNPWYMLIGLQSEIHDKHYFVYKEQHPNHAEIARKMLGLDITKSVPGIYWGTYFNKFYVNWFGKNRFERLKSIEVRWLNNGGIFLQKLDSPFDWKNISSSSVEKKVKESLGENCFFDSQSVRMFLEEIQPQVPYTYSVEKFQPPRHIPNFPFVDDKSEQ